MGMKKKLVTVKKSFEFFCCLLQVAPGYSICHYLNNVNKQLAF